MEFLSATMSLLYLKAEIKVSDKAVLEMSIGTLAV